MKMYIYEVGPIDIGWKFLPTFTSVVEKLTKDYNPLADNHSDEEDLFSFLETWNKVKCKVKENTHWEGDIRWGFKENLYVLPVVDTEDSVSFGFIWKQDNNGTTFIASPSQLIFIDQSFKTVEI